MNTYYRMPKRQLHQQCVSPQSGGEFERVEPTFHGQLELGNVLLPPVRLQFYQTAAATIEIQNRSFVFTVQLETPLNSIQSIVFARYPVSGRIAGTSVCGPTRDLRREVETKVLNVGQIDVSVAHAAVAPAENFLLAHFIGYVKLNAKVHLVRSRPRL